MPTGGQSRAISPSSTNCASASTVSRAAARWLMRQQLLYPLHLLADRASTALGSIAAMGPQAGRDAVYAARSLARTPALTITIALTIGIGLGATTAMIGVVRAVLVNPLPYASPDRLFWLYTDNPPFRFRFSVVDYRALEADHAAFTAVAAYQTSSVTISDVGAAERVTAKVCHRVVLSAPRTGAAPRPPVRRIRRRPQRSARRADRGVLGAAFRQRSIRSRPQHHRRRRQPDHRRRAAKGRRTARA